MNTIFSVASAPTSVRDKLTLVPGTSTLYTYGGNPGIILKQVANATEAAACGGVFCLFSRANNDLWSGTVGLAGVAMNGHFSPSDPISGINVLISASAASTKVKQTADGLLMQDANVRFDLGAPVRAEAAPNTVNMLLLGWVTRAHTGSYWDYTQTLSGSLVDSIRAGSVRAAGGDVTQVGFYGTPTTYRGGVVCLAPIPLKWKLMLTDGKASYLAGNSGEGADYLNRAYDLILAQQPETKVVNQPITTMFGTGASLVIGYAATDNAFDVPADAFTGVPAGFDYSVLSVSEQAEAENGSAPDRDAFPIARCVYTARNPCGSVLGGLVMPSFPTAKFGALGTTSVTSSLPHMINGMTAAGLLGSAFPIQYDTGTFVENGLDVEIMSFMHPQPNETLPPHVETTGEGETATYGLTPAGNYYPRLSWQNSGQGVFGAIMAFYQSVDSRARQLAKDEN